MKDNIKTTERGQTGLLEGGAMDDVRKRRREESWNSLLFQLYLCCVEPCFFVLDRKHRNKWIESEDNEAPMMFPSGGVRINLMEPNLLGRISHFCHSRGNCVLLKTLSIHRNTFPAAWDVLRKCGSPPLVSQRQNKRSWRSELFFFYVGRLLDFCLCGRGDSTITRLDAFDLWHLAKIDVYFLKRGCRQMQLSICWKSGQRSSAAEWKKHFSTTVEGFIFFLFKCWRVSLLKLSMQTFTPDVYLN